jgi:hypothetical protein
MPFYWVKPDFGLAMRPINRILALITGPVELGLDRRVGPLNAGFNID